MEILELKVLNKGPLIAKFNLRIPQIGMTFYDMCYFRKDAKEWITMPSKEYTNQSGEKKYFNLVMVDKDRKDGFDHAIIKVLRPMIYTKPEETSELPF